MPESTQRLAERCRDAWAVLRIVPARDGEEALRRHGRPYDAERFIGTRDGLADDMLDAAKALDAAAEAERETVRRITARLRDRTGQTARTWHERNAVADAIDREFGGEDKGGEPR
jgi:hypothetical protein